uniref:BCAS3 WD40 domain-containing protein n=1 Tax=Dendroctonus ponderosae TaxID=77166 RepID=A0AAR5PV04_DENPD
MHGSSSGSLNFCSLKTGDQVKQIKFKSPILDVVANRRSVVVAFSEKIAVFDAFTLEDKLTITSCYLSPGIQANPIDLGPRWLAFAEKKLVTSRRSSGGNEGEGVQSYTATVLHAAKSLGRGLRELGDAVALSLTGNQVSKLGTSPNSPQAGCSADVPQKGIVTILDVENTSSQNADGSHHPESIVAHFVAHSEAIVWLQFGPCGLLLLTADKRGHDFNLFKIYPHPIGSALTAVHHLYTLHRGDTSARVQDMSFSFDSRWVTVSTLRGTTHVFPITSYGGNIGVRTHTTPHVVNRMSRFHRSAGLTSEGRSNSPVSMFDSPVSSSYPYSNPRFAPYPHPIVVNPLAQLRQPVYMQNVGASIPRQGRQRLTSSSEDNIALRVSTCFAQARAWIDSSATHLSRDTALNKNVKPVESLFIMNCHGNLVQYDLEPHHASHIPKEKVCDDSPIELTVTAKAQWRLQRQPLSIDRPLPLPHQSLIYVFAAVPITNKKLENGNDDDWLSQVEITTHAGPHRRLWMGPQFTFKTYTTTSGTPLSLADAQPLDLNRSKPVNMPITKANAVLIESSSASSSEQSLLDIYRKNCEEMGTAGEHQVRKVLYSIKEDLADAMIESPGARDAGGRCVIVSVKAPPMLPQRASTAPSPIAKVVNPLGTVVTVHSDEECEVVVPEEIVIYENCDETLFRPMVTPKTVNCKSSKADGGNLMTQSLKGDTNVTVRLLDKAEILSGTNWEEPRVQDIRENTKVIVQKGEVRDLMEQKPVDESLIVSKKESKRSNKVNEAAKQRDMNRSTKSKSAKPDNVKLPKESLESQSDKVTGRRFISELQKASTKHSNTTSVEDTLNNGPVKRASQEREFPKQIQPPEPAKQHLSKESESSSTKSPSSSNNSAERETTPPKRLTRRSIERETPMQVDSLSFTTSEKESESKVQEELNSFYNILEDCDTFKSKICKDSVNVDEFASDRLAATTSKRRSKNKKPIIDQEYIASALIDDALPATEPIVIVPEYSMEIEKELDNEVSFTLPKVSSRCRRKARDDTDGNVAGNLLKGLGEITDVSFPALDSKLINPEFPPLEENFFSLENLTKPDKFEDAEDCGLPIEPIGTFIEPIQSSEDHSAIDDQVEERLKAKTPAKKLRKPKPKLGVKIGSLCKEESPERKKESTPERPVAEVSAQITLPRSWSNVVSVKPRQLIKFDSWTTNKSDDTKDSSIDSYTVTLPYKKANVGVSTEKLLDIDTPEENEATDELLEERLEIREKSADVTDLQKLSDKSSDDEKNESGSSPIETTESSDEGKRLRILQNDNKFLEPKSAKKKISKKKK